MNVAQKRGIAVMLVFAMMALAFVPAFPVYADSEVIVESISPADEATVDPQTTTNITVTFSGIMSTTPGTVSISAINGSSETALTAGAWSNDNKTIEYSLDNTVDGNGYVLEESEGYAVKIANFHDINNDIVDEYTSVFYTSHRYGINVSPSAVDFGSIVQTDPIESQIVTVYNSGTEETGVLDIELGGTSPGSFYLPEESLDSIEPGGYQTFEVDKGLYIDQVVGEHRATITISGISVGSIMIPVSLDVVEKTYGIDVSPAAVTFEDIPFTYDSPEPFNVEVYNTGNSPLNKLDITLGGINADKFELSHTELRSLDTSDIGLFQISVKPQTWPAVMEIGDYEAIVTVSGVNVGSIGIPVKVSVVEHTYGIGSDPAEVSFGALAYDNVAPDPQTIEVINTGTGVTSPLDITLGGISPESFNLSKTTLPGFIILDESSTFTIQPDEGLTEGFYQAEIIVSGDSTTGSITIPVEYMVTAAEYGIQLSPGSIIFDEAAYEATIPDPEIITVYNTGASITGELDIALEGTSPESFELSATTLSSIDPGSQESFTVVPAEDLPIGEHNATVSVSNSARGIDEEIDISFTVTTASYGLTLNPSLIEFGEIAAGDEQPDPETITVYNTGTGITGVLDIELGGASGAAFELSETTLASIKENSSSTFTVWPVDNLAVGEYEAVITVSSITKGISDSIEIKINVIQPTYTLTFDAGEGTVSPASISVTVGGVYTGLPTPERTGYSFGGWFIDLDDTESIIIDGEEIALTGNTTVYAKWNQIKVANITMSSAPTFIETGKTHKFTATVTPSDALNKNIKWTASNSNATVDTNGTVTGKKEGTVTITASADGKSVSKTVKIVSQVTKIQTPLTKVNLSFKKSYAPKITCISGTETIKTAMTWKSSNKKVATVNAKNGKIKAGKKAGKATITGTAANGKTVKITVKVTKKATKVKSVKLSGLKSKYKAGQTASIKVKLNPSKATNPNIKFKSSKSSVAKVDAAGKVTFKKKGKVTITVKVGGKSIKKKITVK